MNEPQETQAPARADLLIDCWLSGQIPEQDMLERLGADDLLRRRFERRLGCGLDRLRRDPHTP